MSEPSAELRERCLQFAMSPASDFVGQEFGAPLPWYCSIKDLAKFVQTEIDRAVAATLDTQASVRTVGSDALAQKE